MFGAQRRVSGHVEDAGDVGARADHLVDGVEGGVVEDHVDGGGDSANFIQWMRDWMVARAGPGFLYEAYFNNCDAGNVGSNLNRQYSSGCIYRNPNAAARYTSLWRSPAAL